MCPLPTGEGRFQIGSCALLPTRLLQALFLVAGQDGEIRAWNSNLEGFGIQWTRNCSPGVCSLRDNVMGRKMMLTSALISPQGPGQLPFLLH